MAPYEADVEKARENGLSRRELEVLCLAASGFNSKQVAAHLGTKPETARFHLAGVRRKLEAQTTPAALARAVALGVLRESPSPCRYKCPPPIKREAKPNV